MLDTVVQIISKLVSKYLLCNFWDWVNSSSPEDVKVWQCESLSHILSLFCFIIIILSYTLKVLCYYFALFFDWALSRLYGLKFF